MFFFSLLPTVRFFSPRVRVGPPPLNIVGSNSNLAVGSWPCSVGSCMGIMPCDVLYRG